MRRDTIEYDQINLVYRKILQHLYYNVLYNLIVILITVWNSITNSFRSTIFHSYLLIFELSKYLYHDLFFVFHKIDIWC